MKASIFTVLLFVSLLYSFSPATKLPKYFVAEAVVRVRPTSKIQITRVVKAKDLKEADLIFRKWYKSIPECKGVELPKTGTTESNFGSTGIYDIWEIDFNNVLTK